MRVLAHTFFLVRFFCPSALSANPRRFVSRTDTVLCVEGESRNARFITQHDLTSEDHYRLPPEV